ncbi:MAG: hypothetical protein Q9208_000949 [Pyrenodesmia sp. 3 TL-2023]
MSIPNEALQKLVQEIETQAINAQREINVVKTSIISRQRDIRMLELTSTEIKQLSKDTKVYEGVGKMFVFTPVDHVEKRLASETTELKSDISSLNKKLHYLETTHKNSREHIDQIFRSADSEDLESKFDYDVGMDTHFSHGYLVTWDSMAAGGNPSPRSRKLLTTMFEHRLDAFPGGTNENAVAIGSLLALYRKARPKASPRLRQTPERDHL